MILFDSVRIVGLEPTIRKITEGKTDSNIGCELNQCHKCTFKPSWCGNTPKYIIGPNDLDLMLRLAGAGSVDGKFRRMIVVYVDITAPLYWWKDFDTYRVGVTPNPTDIEMNSCSTMHKIYTKEFTLDDFSHEHLFKLGANANFDQLPKYNYDNEFWDSTLLLQMIIKSLNHYRKKFLETKDKKYWWQMIQLLPSSYNQKRTVMLNYEVLANIYQHRRDHKLDEWRELCKWIEVLPYSEVITCNAHKGEEGEILALQAAINKLRYQKWSEEQITKLLQMAAEPTNPNTEV